MLVQQFTPTQRFVTWSAFKSINYKIRVFWSNSYFRFKLPTALHSPDLLDDKHIQMEIWNDQEKLHHFLPQRPPVCKVKVELVTSTVHKGNREKQTQRKYYGKFEFITCGSSISVCRLWWLRDRGRRARPPQDTPPPLSTDGESSFRQDSRSSYPRVGCK